MSCLYSIIVIVDSILFVHGSSAEPEIEGERQHVMEAAIQSEACSKYYRKQDRRP